MGMDGFLKQFPKLILWVLSLFLWLLPLSARVALEDTFLSSDPEKDTLVCTNLSQFFSKGRYSFHGRSFYMNTINLGEVSDYSAWAAGAGMDYVSPYFKGIRFGFSGFFIFKLHDKNIGGVDPITQGKNRYEVALFDMEDSENSADLDRLEELYLAYKLGNFSVTMGRQHVNTPLLNGQDNRMRPNIFSGLWTRYQHHHHLIEGGVIQGVSPRGTVDWFSVEESLGVYPFGRNVDGSPSEYKGNMHSRGLAILGYHYRKPNLLLNAYNYWAHNIFNLAYVDLIKKHPLSNGSSVDWGLQGVFQSQIGQGGNADPALAYINAGEHTFALGSTLRFAHHGNKFSLNTLYIHDSGRLLFPREWGREQFFISLPRERLEGNGKTRSISLTWENDKLLKNKLTSFIGAGASLLPDPDMPLLNKNGMPSFYHLVYRSTYTLPEFFHGFTFTFLAVYKGSLVDDLPLAYSINRVNMWNLNCILDYRF
jgi:hypothetical protein